MQQITTLQYNDFSVMFQNDAFINATAIAKQFGKRTENYLRTNETKEYVSALQKWLFPADNSNALKSVIEQNQDVSVAPKSVTEQNQLVRVVQGGNNQGTWLHPKLAVNFARWLNADFAVWCDMQIEKLLHPKRNALVDLPPSTISTEMQRHIQEMVKAQHRRTGVHWQTIYDQFKTHFEIPRYDELPITKYAEACLWFGCKTQYDLPQYMLIDVRELENLQSNQLSNCILPPEPQVFPDNYHQFIDIVNKMEDASYRIFKKDILVSLHEMLSKMI